MKLNINEIYVAKTGVENVTVKGSDARMVADLLDKLEKEFVKLKKIEDDNA